MALITGGASEASMMASTSRPRLGRLLLAVVLAVACPYLAADGRPGAAAHGRAGDRVPLTRGPRAEDSLVLRLRGGGKKPFRRVGGSGPGRRGGGNDAHMQSIDIDKFEKDIGAGRKLSRDRRRDAELQQWLRDEPYERPHEEQHSLTSSLHPLNRMAALMRMEKLKKKIERRGKGTRRRLAMAKREAQREQRIRARAAKARAEDNQSKRT
jgi:hypothetical protein